MTDMLQYFGIFDGYFRQYKKANPDKESAEVTAVSPKKLSAEARFIFSRDRLLGCSQKLRM
eukprot:COSAG04_NODE_21_length_38435_cov_79.510382_11_plen_61_part_00